LGLAQLPTRADSCREIQAVPLDVLGNCGRVSGGEAAENAQSSGHLRVSDYRDGVDIASPTVPSWNQLLGWLREMDLLRKAEAT